MPTTTIARRLAGALLFAFLAAPATSAQAELLTDVWLKVTLVSKGVQVEADGALKKTSSKSVHYLYFAGPVPDEGGAFETELQYQLWSETSPGQFEMTTSSTVTMTGSGDLLYRDWYDDFGLPNGSTIGGYDTGMVKIKTDKQGNLKKVALKTFGGEIVDGSVDGTHEYGGSKQLSGKSIPESKLPFTPET